MPDDDMTLGRMVLLYRERAGLTQQQLAGRAGISLRTLRDIEHDRIAQPRAGSLERLAAALALAATDRERLRRTATGAAGPLRIAVLGPLRVRRGSTVVDLPSPLQRRLLGLLALHAGRPVLNAHIVEALWGGDPPSGGVSVVHRHAGQLRKLLQRAARDPTAGVVYRDRSGYRLVPGDVDLDLIRFDELVAGARQAQAEGQHDQALTRFDEALALWRGPVLDDTDPALSNHPAAVAANRRHIEAALAHADLALDAGLFQRATRWLPDLLATDPLHEGLVARLMLALAGTGQQAAALNLYTALRDRLTDELGVDPGAELQAAHLRVLTGAGPDGGGEQRPGRPPVPAQLPPDVPAFTGRTAQLQELDALLAHGAERATAVVISAIAGGGGIGKTSLAVHWAHRVADRFRDGQLYVNLRGFEPAGAPMAAGEAVRGFLDALGVPPAQIPSGLTAQTGLYRSLLAGRRMLVLLDNAHDAEQVRPLLPAAAGCFVLVTSRRRLSGLLATEAAHPLDVDLLSHREGRQLLSRRLGSRRVTAEPEATDEIVDRCARLPLALAIAAARAVSRPALPLAAVAAELRATPAELDAFADDDAHADLRTVFSWSYRTLSPPAARLFRLLGVHPGPEISAPAAASLVGLPPAGVAPLLAALTDAHLLVERAPGRYTFHDLLRAYATELAGTHDADRDLAIHRNLDHYLHTAFAADHALRSHRPAITLTPAHPGVTPEAIADLGAALAWFDAERPVLLAAIDQAGRTGFDDHVWPLAWSLSTYFERKGHWHDWAATQLAAVEAAGRLGDRSRQAHAYRLLAYANTRQARYDEAHRQMRQALDLFAEVGQHSDQAQTHLSMSVVFGRQGLHRDALHHAEQALRLHRTAGDRRGQANALNAVGWYRTQLGEHREALRYCREALALHQDTGDRAGQADTWDSVGFAHHHLGEYDEAVRCYRRAMDLYRELGDVYYEASTLTHLGDAYHAAGDPGAARDAWRRALTILTELNHPDAEQVRMKLAELDRAARIM
jgi:DNA-binding SARP family transcriptional activator/Tfp pilus assembly protein PilF/DNA-binding XRE family transcriptional regulator